MLHKRPSVGWSGGMLPLDFGEAEMFSNHTATFGNLMYESGFGGYQENVML